MIINIDKQDKLSTNFIEEDYFPVIVTFGKQSDYVIHKGFYLSNKNLVEISLDPDTRKIQTLKVVLCENYQVTNSNWNVPRNYEEGVIGFEMNNHVDCDILSMKIYNNAAAICLSNNEPIHFYKCDQVFFGLDNNTLVQICITNLSSNNINHIIEELKYCNE